MDAGTVGCADVCNAGVWHVTCDVWRATCDACYPLPPSLFRACPPAAAATWCLSLLLQQPTFVQIWHQQLQQTQQQQQQQQRRRRQQHRLQLRLPLRRVAARGPKAGVAALPARRATRDVLNTALSCGQILKASWRRRQRPAEVFVLGSSSNGSSSREFSEPPRLSLPPPASPFLLLSSLPYSTLLRAHHVCPSHSST